MGDSSPLPDDDLKKLDAALSAHLMCLSARIDALTSLVLFLAHKQGLDSGKLEPLLRAREQESLKTRLLKTADSHVSSASWSAHYLREWDLHKEKPNASD